MSRPVVIDRNRILDSAETLVRSGGIARLTIGAVAQAAGISKGAVQGAFGTKAQLIDAIYQRWSDEYDTQVIELTGERPTASQALRAHLDLTRRTDEAEADRAAGLMSALLGSNQRQGSDAWYRQRLELIDTSTPQGRRARLAFLAAEGAFMLRCFGFLQMPDSEWQAIFEDVSTQLLEGDDEQKR